MNPVLFDAVTGRREQGLQMKTAKAPRYGRAQNISQDKDDE